MLTSSSSCLTKFHVLVSITIEKYSKKERNVNGEALSHVRHQISEKTENDNIIAKLLRIHAVIYC